MYLCIHINYEYNLLIILTIMQPKEVLYYLLRNIYLFNIYCIGMKLHQHVQNFMPNTKQNVRFHCVHIDFKNHVTFVCPVPTPLGLQPH